MNIIEFSKNREDVKRLQHGLTLVGYLDPNIKGYQVFDHDGIYGPNTAGAFSAFVNSRFENPGDIEDIEMDRVFAEIECGPQLILDDSPASKIVQYMLDHNMYISMAPGTKNIVYLEGVSAQFERFWLNDNNVDEWNDMRLLLEVKNGEPDIVLACEATTGPGKYYIDNPMNPAGTARIAYGQYKSWVVGKHKGTQEALVQSKPVLVYRDVNKDGKRDGDKLHVQEYTINQHTTTPMYNGASVGRFSAGCLVGKHYGSHMVFMARIKEDPRWQANAAYVFMTAILDGKNIF